MSLPEVDPSYYADGHTISFKLDQDTVSIGSVHCPHVGKPAACTRNRTSCVVDTYLKVYGYELNIGETWLTDSVEIAWIPIAGVSDLDDEFGTIWVIPVDDPQFAAILELDAQFQSDSFNPDDDDFEVISDTMTDEGGDHDGREGESTDE